MQNCPPHCPATVISMIHYLPRIIGKCFNPSFGWAYTVSMMRIYAINRKLNRSNCTNIDLLIRYLFAVILYVATYLIVTNNSIRCLRTKAITIRYIDSCAHNVRSICPVRIYWICTCRRRMIHFLPFKPRRSQWYVCVCVCVFVEKITSFSI